MSHYEYIWLIAFLKTQVVEVSLGLSILYFLHTHCSETSPFSFLRVFSVLFMASAITHPPLWFVFPTLRKWAGLSYWQYVWFGELFVFLVEGTWYFIMLSTLKNRFFVAILFSLLLNGASYLVGLYTS